MIDGKLKQFLLDEYSICSSKRKPFTKYIDREFKKRNTDLYTDILYKTKYMDKKYTFEHRLFMYINEYSNFPECKKCGRDHRYNCRKSELPKKLNNVDITKTEHEIMVENNIFRIYDCGSYRFDLELGVYSPNSNLTNN